MEDNNVKGKSNLKSKVGIKKLHLVIAASAAFALVLGGAITAGIFIAKDVNTQNEIKKENESVIIDSSCSETTTISKEFTADKDGNKVGTISSKDGKLITGVSVSKGDVSLKETEEFVATPIEVNSDSKNSSKNNSSASWNIVVLKDALTKHSGKLRIVANYENTPTPPPVTEKVKVTFNDQFEGGASTNVVEINKGDCVSYQSTAHHDNYDFIGWYTDKECSKKYDFDTPVYEDLELYGKWEKAPEGEIEGLLFIPDSEDEPTSYTVTADADNYLKLPKNLVIPSTYNNLPVVGIYDIPSYNDGSKTSYRLALTKIETVSIPSTFKKIPDNAFRGCSNLVSVSLPDTITEIGYCAFYECYELKSINLNEGIRSIYNAAFYGSALEEVKLPSTLTTLDYYSFNWCPNLKKVDLSKCNSLIYLGPGSFNSCYSLEEVLLPMDGILQYFGGYTFAYCYCLKSIDIPSSIRELGSDMFYSCYCLVNVNFPEDSKLNRINDYAFEDCYSLKSLDIPSNVTYINGYAFYSCNNLKNINFKNTTNSYYVTYYDKDLDKEVEIEDYNPHGDIKPVYYAKNYGSFEINGIKNKEANLEYIPISEDECLITGKGEDTSVADIVIPLEIKEDSKTYKVVGINGNAFSEYGGAIGKNLTSITFEVNEETGVNENFTDIGDYAFDTCSVVGAINNLDKCVNLERIGKYAFYNIGSNNKEFSLNLDLTDTKLESIGYGAFEYVTGLKEIKLPETLSAIDNFAFANCSNLSVVDFTKCENLLMLGYQYYYGGLYGGGVFQYCTALNSVDLSNTKLVSIPAYTFSNIKNLKTVKLPKTLTTIGEYAFAYSPLDEIVIPENVVDIRNGAFANSQAYLKTLTFDTPMFAVIYSNKDYNGVFGSAKTVYIKEEVITGSDFLESFEKQETSEKEGYDKYIVKKGR